MTGMNRAVIKKAVLLYFKSIFSDQVKFFTMMSTPFVSELQLLMVYQKYERVDGSVHGMLLHVHEMQITRQRAPETLM